MPEGRGNVMRPVVHRSDAAALAALLFCGALGSSVSADEAANPSAAELMDELMWNRSPIGGPFALIDQDGRRRADTEFRGKLMVLYFGYTYCPDVCPTDLLAISAAIRLLGDAGDDVQPIFITVDPQRDTVERLRGYVSTFHPRLIGLTGSEHNIRTLALAYKAYYAKIAAEHGEPYAIDHTGFIYLVGRDGKYLGFFPPGTPPDRMMEIIRQHLPK
jgi:cytochrome oxidase Cu insertion factor (SCO1/SenC/PrrC family)